MLIVVVFFVAIIRTFLPPEKIRIIREVTGLGLKEAKDLADNVPAVIKRGVSREEAETVRKRLAEAGGTAEIEEIAKDKAKAKKFARANDFFVAEAPLMPTIGKRLGIILAPRGKMPKPIPPGSDPKAAIDKLKVSVSVRTRDKKTFHLAIGTNSMSPEDLAENLDAVIKRLTTRLERGKMNIRSAYVKTTMGPSFKVI